MNRYDEKYIFRLAKESDIEQIMNFYKKEWHKNHILANDKEFFRYQHQVDNCVNFMLAINKETNSIEAAEGFIQYSRELKDIAAVMWKTSSSASMPFLGVEVIKRLKEATRCRIYLGCGTNPKTAVPLQKNMLKHNVGRLKHYYLLADIDDFKIAVINKNRKTNFSSNNQNKLVEINYIKELQCNYNFEKESLSKPFKDEWYINKRYFNHPFYKYLIWAVQVKNNRFSAIVVAREIEFNSTKVLRIMDYLGDTNAFSGLGMEMKRLIKQNNYEYIDFYCTGIEKKSLNEAGFICKTDIDDNIIPNYFEPFIRKNIDIWYTSSDKNTLLFKGDGDQDRPN
jgi:hypothetical protein